MRRIAQIFIFLFALCRATIAAEVVPTVDGESFNKRFDGAPPHGDKLIEFVRDNEAFDAWTKLVAYRYQQLPRLDNDPVKYGLALGQVVKQANPQAAVKVDRDEKSGDAMVDFLSWPSDQNYMELNVWRLRKSADGKAVISLQLAYKFPMPKRPELQPMDLPSTSAPRRLYGSGVSRSSSRRLTRTRSLSKALSSHLEPPAGQAAVLSLPACSWSCALPGE